MPFTSNWLEELVAEWLQLDGYCVEVGLPVSVMKVGGRFEADVVGAKVVNNELQIRHIECGQLPSGEQSIKSLQNKFSDRNRSSIEEYFKQRFGIVGKVNYDKLYVASYWSRPVIEKAGKLGIIIITLPDFIVNEVLPTIHKWRDNAPQQPRTRGKHITLPQSCWFLQLIDYLHNRGLLNQS